MSGSRAAWLRHAGAVALVKTVASLVALGTGFRAVSDDDYARVVIAEQWAHAPKLDPSGTSWLPLPFWLNGSAMLVFGRSLGTARAVAFALGVASAVLVYQAARWMTGDRRAAMAGAIFAAAFPWSARLGVATVPELPTAALAVLAIATLMAGVEAKWRVLGGAALLAATLSRYEVWFLAIGFAALSGWDARTRRSDRGALLGGAALSLLGPGLWVIWNRFAHGDALHFIARVTAYHRALGADGRVDLGVGYPMALIRAEPELVVAALVGAAGLAWMGAAGGRDVLRRYARPTALSGCMIAALMISAAREGAPTHHAERALLVVMLLLAVFAGDAIVHLVALPRAHTAIAVVAALCAAVIAGVLLRSRPDAESASVDRGGEVAVGEAAARMVTTGNRLLVEVVDYGYLAIVAGFARPEDAVMDRDIDPRRAQTTSSFDDIATLKTRLGTADARAFVARRSAIASGLGDEGETRGAVWGVFAQRTEPPSAAR